MLKEHAKLLYLFQQSGQVNGRKKLQKMVYISKKFQFDFQERFNFHFYGPYSEELTLQMEELINLGFIQEVKETKAGYTQYKYELSDKGREYLEVYPTSMESYNSFVQLLNHESSRFLELVSTLLYFNHLDEVSLTEKVQKVKSKQNYSLEEIQMAVQFIDQLSQFSTNKN